MVAQFAEELSRDEVEVYLFPRGLGILVLGLNDGAVKLYFFIAEGFTFLVGRLQQLYLFDGQPAWVVFV